MVNQSLLLLAITLALSSCLAAASTLDTIRALLGQIERNERMEEQGRDLDSEVSEIVERVFSPQVPTRFTRKEGDICVEPDGTKWTASE